MNVVPLAMGFPVMLICAVAFMARPSILTLVALIALPSVLLKAGMKFSGGGRMGSGYPMHAQAFGGMAPWPGERLTFGGVVSGFARFVLSTVGGLMLLAAVVLMLGVAGDVPGLLAASVTDTHFLRDMERGLGPNWPRVLREMGTVGMAVAAFGAIVLLMMARRSLGALHMLRALVGTGVVLGAAAALGAALPRWADGAP